MDLFRPVGEKEYLLIQESGFKTFPPRLPEQPIFYPVLNQEYAAEIASKWNAKDGQKGYVLKFAVDDDFILKYEPHTVGAGYHQELWIPADELDEFNDHIIGTITVAAIY